MQGLWKEKLQGYDRKGTRRKKTSRKHNIKYKVDFLTKKTKSELMELGIDSESFSFDKEFYDYRIKIFKKNIYVYDKLLLNSPYIHLCVVDKSKYVRNLSMRKERTYTRNWIKKANWEQQPVDRFTKYLYTLW